MSKTTPSISRLPCERCGGPVESDNGWLGQRVAYPPDWGVDLNPHKPKLAKYALCWKCVGRSRISDDPLTEAHQAHAQKRSKREGWKDIIP